MRFAQLVNTTAHIDYTKGAIDFWFNPSFDHDDPVDPAHAADQFFFTASPGMGGFRFRIAAGPADMGNRRHMQFIILDAAGA